METILHLKRILSGINLVALAIRRTYILRFTTHSWRQLGKQKAVAKPVIYIQVKWKYYRVIYTKFTSLSMFDTYLSVYLHSFVEFSIVIRCHFIQAWRAALIHRYKYN